MFVPFGARNVINSYYFLSFNESAWLLYSSCRSVCCQGRVVAVGVQQETYQTASKLEPSIL